MPDTICGYGLVDVRKSLVEAIERRDRRAALRWTAELVATPAATGSLWAAYWIAWSTASSGPTLPILLNQSWDAMTALATSALVENGGSEADGWRAFRNERDVRVLASEQTMRLLGQLCQTPTVWPTKEITLHDVGRLRAQPPPPSSDGPVMMLVWRREVDAMDLRVLGGRWLDALETGDLRTALSIMNWTMLVPASDLRCADRGPAELNPKARTSPLWFWLDLGRAMIVHRVHERGLHRGWSTMNAAVATAFRLHYKRWTPSDRMRVALAWVLQLRGSFLPSVDGQWSAPPVQQTLDAVDLPYKEIAAELSDPRAVVRGTAEPSPMSATKAAKISKEAAQAAMEAKLAETDDIVLSAMGIPR